MPRRLWTSFDYQSRKCEVNPGYVRLLEHLAACAAPTLTRPVLRIRIRFRIHRIHMILGLLYPDPLVRGMDPDPDLDPSITKQK
jgi:hypothetical protein